MLPVGVAPGPGANHWWIGPAGSSWVVCLLRPLPLTDRALSRLITPVVETTGHVACSSFSLEFLPHDHLSSWVEIACDESGFSGTNLLDPASPVITHASVDLAIPEAAEVVAILRSRLLRRSEYKSNQLLRPAQRAALEWFLTALRGHAHVHVIDKTGYVAARVLELFTEEPSYGAGTSLGRDHSDVVLALRRRTGFLAAFVDLTRTKRVRLIDHDAIGRFFATMPTDLPALRGVTSARVEEVMARLINDDPAFPPPLEPLVPALAETVLFWSAGRGRSPWCMTSRAR